MKDNQPNIVAIGNAPSSGSTFLADLLDSSSEAVCGPELNLFSNQSIYAYDTYRGAPLKSSRTKSVYMMTDKLYLKHLVKYGFSGEEFAQMARQCDSLRELINTFGLKYLALRGKTLNGTVFEKTPQNIGCASSFLDVFNKGYFIHVLRNPVYVYSSLRKRGIPRYIALATWLIDLASIEDLRSHPRMIEIRYEDLVEDPFNISSDIIYRVGGKRVDPEALKKAYETNSYRKFHSTKIDSWSSNVHGKIGNANKRRISNEELQDIVLLKKYKVSREYSKAFGVPEYSFAELLERTGYDKELEELLSSLPEAISEKKIRPCTKANMHLVRKFLRDFKHRDVSWANARGYFTPLERV